MAKILNNPCCGLDLHRGAKIVAVIDVIISITELVAAVVFESGPITILSTESDHPENRDVNYIVSMSLLFGVCLVIMRIIQLGCSILLLYGVVERNHKKCEVWLIFSFVVVTLAFLQVLFEIFVRERLNTDPEPLVLRLFIPVTELLFTWYIIWVIFTFMRYIKKVHLPRRDDEEGREMIETNKM